MYLRNRYKKWEKNQNMNKQKTPGWQKFDITTKYHELERSIESSIQGNKIGITCLPYYLPYIFKDLDFGDTHPS